MFKRFFVFVLLAASSVLAESSPSLQFVKRIGDARGKSLDNIAVALGMDGNVRLFQRFGRVILFDKNGKYIESLDVDKSHLNWRHRYSYMTVLGQNILLGTCEQDYAWVYEARRAGDAPGQFASPAYVTADDTGQIYVADQKNQRVQIFAPGQHEKPVRIVELSFDPKIIAVKKHGDQMLLAVGDDNRVELLGLTKDTQQSLATLKIRHLRCLAIDVSQDVEIYVASRNELFRYRVSAGEFTKKELIAPSYDKQWPDIFQWDVSMVTHEDGKIYYATDHYAKLMALDSADDSIRVVGQLPWRTRAVTFGPNDRVYASSIDNKMVVMHQFKLGQDGLEAVGKYVEQPLYENEHVPVWDVLWDDGGLLVRIVEEGHKKGWTALTLKRLMPNGQSKPFLDFGPLYAVRAKFHPSVATYALEHDRDQNIAFTAMPLKAVYKVKSDGSILWEAGLIPQGGADKIDFSHPRDLAIDSHNRIWVTDYLKDQIFCLSTEGKLLYQFGKHVGVDDVDGSGFDQPCGIAISKVGDEEFLYVGDSHNQRLLKYRIVEATQAIE